MKMMDSVDLLASAAASSAVPVEGDFSVAIFFN